MVGAGRTHGRTDTQRAERGEARRAGLGGLLQQLDVTHNQLLPVNKSHSALFLREQLSLHQGFLEDLQAERSGSESRLASPGRADPFRAGSPGGGPKQSRRPAFLQEGERGRGSPAGLHCFARGAPECGGPARTPQDTAEACTQPPTIGPATRARAQGTGHSGT